MKAELAQVTLFGDFSEVDMIIGEVDLQNEFAAKKEELSKLIDLDSRQKASVKWDVEDDPNDIKSKFFDYYKSKFEALQIDADFGNIRPNICLSNNEAKCHEADVDDAEIKNAVWSCGSSKAPGPDGANSEFFSLIPKVNNPVLINDFRPISLVGCFYKTVTKILTNRLQGVIDKIISPVQLAFISGRQILDGPLMLSEIISWYKKKNKKMLLFKVDFEKALECPRDEAYHPYFGDFFRLGVVDSETISIANSVGARVCSFPTTYLGIPIGSTMKAIAKWDTLCEKFRSKLSSWKASLISAGGRLTLVKAVMGSIARFFWGGNNSVKKMAWLKWDKVLAPFDKGGLNVGSLKAFNLALIYKWRWRYLTSPNDMWVTIIKSIHGNCFNVTASSNSTVWSNIVNTCSKCCTDELIPTDIFRMTIGNGRHIRFWLDYWSGNAPLASRFNRLYHLDSAPNDSVANKLVNGVWQIAWVRENLRGRNDQLFNDLLEELGCPVLNDRPDSWSCSISNEGMYTVKDAREYIDRHFLASSPIETIWFKHVPRKVNIFLWRFRLDYLPVRWNLSAKGIDINSVVCPICNNGVETREHLFFECDLARELWHKIRLWLNCGMPHFDSWYSFISWSPWKLGMSKWSEKPKPIPYRTGTGTENGTERRKKKVKEKMMKEEEE
ncbi:uncharacterized protein [Rutidosis leptorrhynchoides]|uniref:uncharacterized protein n=1 Tax=Rutidosis leptorrhynchoides TaxID=125765 RepID=UPI003A992BF8